MGLFHFEFDPNPKTKRNRKDRSQSLIGSQAHIGIVANQGRLHKE